MHMSSHYKMQHVYVTCSSEMFVNLFTNLFKPLALTQLQVICLFLRQSYCIINKYIVFAGMIQHAVLLLISIVLC